LVQPKKSLNREFPICKERWRGWERKRGGWASRSAGRHI
jgi:hypothetical protein